MAGLSRSTMQPIGASQHIKQSIDLILTTPVGSRLMRRDFGVSYLNESGLISDISTESLAKIAEAALKKWEPRIHVFDLRMEGDGRVPQIVVSYQEKESKEHCTVRVRLPAS